MSKRKKSTKKFRLKHPRQVGKFYSINDNKGGHPGKVFYANPDEDIYYIVRFSKTFRKGRTKLLHSIDPNSKEKQYVVNRPTTEGFDDMEYKEKYSSYRVHPEDVEIVRSIENKYLEEKKK